MNGYKKPGKKLVRTSHQLIRAPTQPMMDEQQRTCIESRLGAANSGLASDDPRRKHRLVKLILTQWHFSVIHVFGRSK